MSYDNTLHHYGTEFNTSSAEELIPYLMKEFKPTSVIDVGCGIGTWLKIFKNQEVDDILGVDGCHILVEERLMISKENILIINLEELSFSKINKRFDLALCLEVAEHLNEKYAAKFISELCKLSNIIIFSAAIPGQTGENHCNEQFPSYWQKHFDNNGFVMCDPFRSLFWDNEKIEWWYKQNMYLFIPKDSSLISKFQQWDGKVYVHPVLYKSYIHFCKSINLSSLSNYNILNRMRFSFLIKYILKRFISTFHS
jgi:SAM-dependent methyltransferase